MLSCAAMLPARIGHAPTRDLLIVWGLLPGIAAATNTILPLIELRNDPIGNAARKLKNLSMTLADGIGRGLQSAWGYRFSAAVPGPDMPGLLRRLRVMTDLPHASAAPATALV
jgi:hypothetical protein